MTTPTPFRTAAAFERWLAKNHATATEILVEFAKRSSDRESIAYAEALDLALAYGWIDGVRRSAGAASYTIRFTPRRPHSIWSAVNVAKVEALIASGRMRPEGLAAYRARDAAKSRQYSYERADAALDAASEKEFRSHRKAWEFFAAQPPGYRKMAAWWVVSAKRAETRVRRLSALIDRSAEGRRLAMLSPGKR